MVTAFNGFLESVRQHVQKEGSGICKGHREGKIGLNSLP